MHVAEKSRDGTYRYRPLNSQVFEREREKKKREREYTLSLFLASDQFMGQPISLEVLCSGVFFHMKPPFLYTLE